MAIRCSRLRSLAVKRSGAVDRFRFCRNGVATCTSARSTRIERAMEHEARAVSQRAVAEHPLRDKQRAAAWWRPSPPEGPPPAADVGSVMVCLNLDVLVSQCSSYWLMHDQQEV